MIVRDAQGFGHVVPCSGGHDSTTVAFLLQDREPRAYTYICTPTGDELPEMFEWWLWLGQALGSRLIPIMEGRTLFDWSRHKKAIPNRSLRHCTPGLKIIPFANWLAEHASDGPVIVYGGLRADEETRAGAIYPTLPNVTQRFILRELGMGDPEVLTFLEQRDILWRIPERTDCARCYHQRIGEWWRLWHDHLHLFMEAVEFESEMGSTFRTPRLNEDGSPVMVTRMGLTYPACWQDTWPVRLADMLVLFERGYVPTVRNDPRSRDLFRSGPCRACSL